MGLKTFGEWLRHRRLQLGISPFKMVEELGYKRVSAIYNFEYGIAPLPMAKWPVMARVLELPLEKFLAVMERYAPQKVAEFRTIRGAASGSAGDGPGRGGIGSEASRPPDKIIGGQVAPQPIQGLRTYRLEKAQIALVVHGSSCERLFPYIDGVWERGEKLGVMELASIHPFPGTVVIERLKQVSTIGIFEWGIRPSIAALIKAAFLDALTGMVGYPHIHRVPKIYTCILDDNSGPIEPEDLKVFLGLLGRGTDIRMLRLTGRSEVRA